MEKRQLGRTGLAVSRLALGTWTWGQETDIDDAAGQLHAWDELTPLEESLATLDLAVTSGRVRYIGISNYSGWQTAKAAAWQRAWPGRTPLASTQVEYSLLARRVEAEVLPAAADAGLGVLAWSPLGRGVLTGKYRNGIPAGSAPHPSGGRGSSARSSPGGRRRSWTRWSPRPALGVSPAEVALAWVRDRPGVTAPVIGARTLDQLTGSLRAENLTLPDDIRDALDEVSASRA